MPKAHDGIKTCSACRIEFPVEKFGGNRAQPDGYNNQCRVCSQKSRIDYKNKYPERHLARHRKNRYGVDLETYLEMLDKQGSVCYICKSPPFPFKTLDLDHCHATGTVRKLLCRGCNSALGGAKDRPDILRALADYLEVHKVKEE